MTTANFEKVVEILFNGAPSEKARVFVNKIADQIRAKGDEWIVANERSLHITDNDIADESIAPIEDNRVWYMTEWQMALLK
ncbi:MAG: hypothetical protein WAW87_03880 [Candidatus Ferrigenium altingense]